MLCFLIHDAGAASGSPSSFAFFSVGLAASSSALRLPAAGAAPFAAAAGAFFFFFTIPVRSFTGACAPTVLDALGPFNAASSACATSVGADVAWASGSSFGDASSSICAEGRER